MIRIEDSVFIEKWKCVYSDWNYLKLWGVFPFFYETINVKILECKSESESRFIVPESPVSFPSFKKKKKKVLLNKALTQETIAAMKAT